MSDYGIQLTVVPRDLYYVERRLVADQAAEILLLREALRSIADGDAYHDGAAKFMAIARAALARDA